MQKLNYHIVIAYQSYATLRNSIRVVKDYL